MEPHSLSLSRRQGYACFGYNGPKPKLVRLQGLGGVLWTKQIARSCAGCSSNRQLARELGVADSTCLARVAALQDRGVITGFHAAVDLGGIGRSVQAHVSIKIRPQALPTASAFCDAVADLPDVIAVYMVTGEADLLAHVAVPTTDELREFVLQLARRPEIADIRSSIIYLSRRAKVIEPLDGP
ncbi:Lrp/AsnC family transcriptional regulator [Streptomyces malaysiensis]|uniref:Lrp/AsnC family transcriptional regulator n=1 Tax=Streptomyces malaysiensis TaxID=92644 RepID=UPI001FCCDA57|nr:Lrp/AsnC family transcriptional regulator [Streptomyces malaysiensis]